MSKLARFVAAAACVVIIAAPASAAPTIDSLTAAATPTGVGVTVKPTFTGTTVVVGTDTADGGLQSGANIPGLGIKDASITPVTPTVLRFNIGLTNPISQGDIWSIPEVYQFNWDLAVTSGSTVTEVSLMAQRTSQWHHTGTADPAFNVASCTTDPTTGQGSCTSTAVTGSFSAAGINIDVPAGTIGAKPGATISVAGEGIVSTLSAAGGVWLNNLGGDQLNGLDDYVVPTPTVTVGIAAAGTPDELVTQTVAAKGNTSFKTFTATLPTPVSGTHRIVTSACFEEACTLAGMDYIQP